MTDSGTQNNSRILLVLFCCLNLLIYLDRGAISSNGVNSDGIQQDFSPTLFQDGLLPAAFMVGLLLSSPIFAVMSMKCDPMRLIGYGLSIWAISVFLCGCSLGFWSLVACRMAVGVGEASFVALASPFIDDTAPQNHKALWLGLFNTCIPVGYALGFLYGGTVAVAIGWRGAFLLESFMMLPFIAWCFRIDVGPLLYHCSQRDDSADTSTEDEGYLKTIWTTVTVGLQLFRKHHVFLLTSLGMTCYTGVIGSYAYYGPDAAKSVFNVSSKQADVAFSIMTVMTGILGTFSGGYLLDLVGASIRNGMVLCSVSMMIAACIIAVAFLALPHFVGFCFVFSIGEFLLFATQAPGNALLLWSVPHKYRALAMSMAVACMHVFGDVPGPPLMGLLQGHIGTWRGTMALAAIVIALGSAFYGAGIYAAHSATDFRHRIVSPQNDLISSANQQDATGDEDEQHMLIS